MNVQNLFYTAIRALARNKMRSALTSIGIIIGVSSVIVMVGIGNSAKIAVKDKIYSFGSNAMRIYSFNRLFLPTDVENIKKEFYQIKYITPLNTFSHNWVVKHRNLSTKSKVMGVANEYLYLQDRKLKTGRLFTEEEIRSTSKVAMIGEKTWKDLFGFTSPIGQQIVVQNTPFTVIGTLEEAGQAFDGTDWDNIILVPYTTGNTRFMNRISFNEIYISVDDENKIDPTVADLRAYMRRKHSLPDGAEDDFKINTSKDKLKLANDISNALAILLAGIASISLFVGGVGIMNIMLVSVTERTREIGIRMAIGAKKNDIMYQFLIESVTLSSVGGIIGILLGLLIYYIIIYFVKWPFVLSPISIVVSVLFAAGVGIFFGYYPSKKASSLKPIDALKYE